MTRKLEPTDRGTDAPVVTFMSPETLIHALHGWAVSAEHTDGTVIGVLTPLSYAESDTDLLMVEIRDVLTDELVCRTDVRNFDRIIVP